MLKWLGWAGVCGALAAAVYESRLPVDQARYGWFTLFGLLLVVPAGIGLAMPQGARTLLRHPRLLIPLGVRTGVYALILWMATWPFWKEMMEASAHWSILSIDVGLTIPFLLVSFVDIVYAAWVTPLLLDTIRRDRCDPHVALERAPGYLARTFGLMAVGALGFLAMVGLMFTLIKGGVPIFPMLIVIAILALVWNVMFAGLLLVGVEHRGSFGSALAAGLTASKRAWRSILLPVVAQMLLMGWVKYLAPKSQTLWHVNARFTGGYDDSCSWYEKLNEMVGTAGPPIAAFLITLMFAVVALATKIEIARRLGSRTHAVDYAREF